MANPQQEMQKSFARVLGYDGPMQGFGNFIQSDPAISEKYKGMLAIAEKQRDMAKQNMMKMSQAPKPQMAKGGVVRRMQVGGAIGNPADMEQFPIAEVQPGGNVMPRGERDQTSALQNSSGGINQPATLQGVKQ